MLNGIFGPKIEVVTGYWRKFHNEESHGSRPDSHPNINRINKSRKMKRSEPVSRMGEVRNSCEVFVGNP
jgi:hypothetical protein